MTCCSKEKINRPKYDIADIFLNNLDKLGLISQEQWKVVNAITSCRTAKLGGHILKCNKCGYEEQSYNSCRNRHCPKCQALVRMIWVEKRTNELLPIQYFHVVFSVPNILNDLILCNKRIIYNILFRTVKETLLEAAKNPKNIGAEIGFICILHTWGQNLMDHPHMHCVVTGGGLSHNGRKWISCKKDFFIHIKILSALFRGKFLDYLKKAYKVGSLNFYGKIKAIEHPEKFKKYINKAYDKKWITYSKEPFANPEHVLKYLGRYTNRIAISNNRIVAVKDNKVGFRWKDYKDGCKIKIMTLDVSEFMRRFLLHVLPKGFVRIRCYGLLSNRNKKEKIDICHRLLKVNHDKIKHVKEYETWQELLFHFTGIDVSRCPKCKNGLLEIISDIPALQFDEKQVYKIDSS